MRTTLFAIAIAASLSATAQPGPGPGPGKGPNEERRWGADITPGWSLMTDAERKEHQDRMRSMTSMADCSAYMEQHHKLMEARAKERGKAVPPAGPRPERACRGLK